MKNAGQVLDYFVSGGVEVVFGIPAGSVNAFFDELLDRPITPVVTKHEGAAAFMATAYAKYSGKVGVVIGCSGPGAMNLVSGAANARREQIPLLILTGAVPVPTMGWNASQELDAAPVFAPVTKYSKTVTDPSQLLHEIHTAVSIAVTGIPGPVHIAMPIDVQLHPAFNHPIPVFPASKPEPVDPVIIEELALKLNQTERGVFFIGNGSRTAGEQLLKLAEALQWPFVTTPMAKGLYPSDHPLNAGIYGFAGHESATQLVHEGDHDVLVIFGSSLGETATSNYQRQLTQDRYVIQIDRDPSVFEKSYVIDRPIQADIEKLISQLLPAVTPRSILPETAAAAEVQGTTVQYDTKNVLRILQGIFPEQTRYTADIGEFMAYVLHHMDVKQPHTFDINVHYGSMGTGIGSAIGLALADRSSPIVSITGDGCFFMHGMEVITAKEYNLPVTFLVMNNSRLGMVHHGHNLQYKRVHDRFSQSFISISAVGQALGLPHYQITSLDDLERDDEVASFLQADGPKILEVVLVDDQVPPMGDRVKFLSSFGK